MLMPDSVTRFPVGAMPTRLPVCVKWSIFGFQPQHSLCTALMPRRHDSHLGISTSKNAHLCRCADTWSACLEQYPPVHNHKQDATKPGQDHLAETLISLFTPLSQQMLQSMPIRMSPVNL